MTVKTELTAELTPIEKLIPHEKNAKKHSDEQVAILSGLIKRHGWTQPIVVDKDGVIIAGHGRRLAALKLGLNKVPVVWRRDLSKQEADALRLADNRVVSNDYDTQLLQDSILELHSEGYAIEDLGFSAKELEFVTADLGAMDESVFVDDVSEAVEDQKAQNETKTDEIDKTQAPIGDALGFKRVTIEQSRRIRTFMTALEEKTGLKGADAFLAHLEGQGA